MTYSNCQVYGFSSHTRDKKRYNKERVGQDGVVYDHTLGLDRLTRADNIVENANCIVVLPRLR